MPLLRFLETYSPSFSESIPGDIDAFLQRTPFLKRFTKYLKRHLILLLTRQLSLETDHIPQNTQHILWINLSSPSLGDTLMDLAGRALLEKYKVTLLTDPFTVQLYQSDRFFCRATDDSTTIQNDSFDHVLIDSFGTKGIRTKLKTARSTTFSGMYGFFDGPEINKILFSYFRINQLLNHPLTEAEINQQATTHIYPGDVEQNALHKLSLPNEFTVIAVGGEWDHRVYDHWAEVIEQLPDSTHFTLIGSSNGSQDAQHIMSSVSSHTLHNFVGKLSIMETTALIARSQLLLCADGGLMHIAHGLNIPTVTLFATVHPQHFTTAANQTTTLYDDEAVRNIPAKEIVQIATPLIREV